MTLLERWLLRLLIRSRCIFWCLHQDVGARVHFKFVSVDLGKQIESAEFKVSLGTVYTVLFDQPPGTARGGEVFVPQPRVRLQTEDTILSSLI